MARNLICVLIVTLKCSNYCALITFLSSIQEDHSKKIISLVRNAFVLFYVDGEPKSLESAVAALGPIAKEYIAKWEKEEKEQVSQHQCTVTV